MKDQERITHKELEKEIFKVEGFKVLLPEEFTYLHYPYKSKYSDKSTVDDYTAARLAPLVQEAKHYKYLHNLINDAFEY